jgi:dTDP-4-dehydrorhamnose 3,5-epimerase
MRFIDTTIEGARLIELERKSDHRGFFARAFCQREFEAEGLASCIAQISFSSSRRRGTVRGMHFQGPPALEPKVVRCIRGAVWDVLIDFRPDSPTFGRQFAVRLDAESHRAVYIPPLVAHGHQTLEDDVELLYLCGEFHTPGTEIGVRPEDPALNLEWPLPITEISEKDRSWTLLENRPEWLGAAFSPR